MIASQTISRDSKNLSLWQEQAPPPSGLGDDPLPKLADVAIVGGGYTGLGAALWLSRFGAKAVVLERYQLTYGASSRNGGKALVGLKRDASVLVKKFGPVRGRALWQASLDGIAAVEQMVTEERIACDFKRYGSLFAAAKSSHYEKMCRETEWLKKNLGYERFNISKSELRKEIGTDAYHGGVVDELSAGLHPAKYAVGLAVAARRAGASLSAMTDVQVIHSSHGMFTITTSRGTLVAKEVLIATNGYTGSLVPYIQRRVVPVGSYIIATEPLSAGVQNEISPRGRMFYDSKWYLNYFRLTPDGRMLFGGRTTISTDQDLTVSARILREAMVKIFPMLRGTLVTHSWTGHLGVTFDGLPHIGRFERIHYALGYSGHGVALSIYLAREVAELMAGKRKSSIFLEIGHPTNFFYHGQPWFRPLMGKVLKVLDWVS